MDSTQVTQTANTGNNSNAQGNGQKGPERMFTQEEVNGIIQTRMARMKEQAGKEASVEYESKLHDLEAREHRLMIVETLHKKGLSSDLADIITCTDEEDLKNKLETLERIYNPESETKAPIRIGAPGSGFRFLNAEQGRSDPIRKAMGMKE